MIPVADDLTPAEVAQRLRVSRAAVHAWLRKGLLRGYQPRGSRVWRVPLAVLDDFCPPANPPPEAVEPRRRKPRLASAAVIEARRRREREQLAAAGLL